MPILLLGNLNVCNTVKSINFNEVLFVHKLLNINQFKAKQTYIERSSFQCVSYLRVNGSHCKGPPPLYCGTALEEEASWFDSCASSWSVPNNTLLSSLLLEELATIMCFRHAIDFSLCNYTNLMNIYIINFDFFLNKSSNTSLILETTHNFQSCKYTTYMP